VHKNYGLVTSIHELGELLDRCGSDVCGYDIETGYHGPPQEKYSLHPETAFITGFSFTNSDEWARYVPLAHDQGDNLDPQAAAELLWSWLNQGKAVPYNAVFELRHTSRFFRQHLSDHPRFGDAVRETDGYFPVYSDALAEEYTLAEQKQYGLKYVTEQTYGHRMTELIDLFPDLPKKLAKTVRFNVLELTPQAVEYACEDALWTLKLHRDNYPRIKDHFIYRLEMAVIPVVCEMEDFGIQYDWDLIRRSAAELKEFQQLFLPEIQQEISDLVGEPMHVNLGSAKQLRSVLYDRLGMRVNRFTPGTRKKPKDERVMSTDAQALGTLAKRHPIVERIVQYKETQTLGTRYLTKYLNFDFAEDHRAHPSHLNCHVISGRFAVTDPVYNQSPGTYHYELASDATFHLNYRNVISSPSEYYLLGFDIEQAELRGIAGMAQESVLLEAFANGVDPHKATASMMLGKPLDSITDKDRDRGKTFNFSLLYGLGDESLSEKLGIPLKEAETLRGKFLAGYRAIARWSAEQVRFGHEHGYVLSLFGRRIPIWEFDSADWPIRNKGERLCVNAPIQASATGDYGKLCMVRSRTAIRQAGLAKKIHLVMNLHDALYYYVHESITPQAVIDLLEPVVVIPIPGWPRMNVEWSIGRRWGSMHKLIRDEAGMLMPKPKKADEPEDLGERPVEDDSNDTGGSVPAEDVVDLDTIPDPAPDPVLSVRITDMPAEDRYNQFLALIRSSPGMSPVELHTPEGPLMLQGEHTGLTPADQPRISLILGGAQVRYRSAELDVPRITHDLQQGDNHEMATSLDR
jgi:DNA polymerase-1